MSTVDREPIRVLHVDDEPDFTELTATFLEREREDFEVSTATSASDGLDHLAEGDIDCVVSDYNMPGMNGLEFLEAVREEHPDLPFILFTGRGSEEIASEAITAGITEYLNKGSGTDQYTVLANRITNVVSQHRAERELQTSTERIRQLYGGITDAIFVLDSDWRFTYLNDRAEEILERTEAELIGESVWDQFPEAVDTIFQDEYEKAMAQRVAVEFETFYPSLDVWVEVRAIPVDDGVTVHFRDISEKKEREQTIQRQNERLRTIVENAPVVLFAFDEDGIITLAEGRGLAELGLEPGEVVGESVFDIYAGTQIAEDTRRAIDGEAVHSTVDLDDRTFEAWYQPVKNGGETGSQTIGVAIDVTDRAERERRFDAVFNNTFQFTGLLQPDGTLIEINDTALQFTGNNREAVVGQPFWELAPWEASEGASGRVKDAIERAANGEFIRFEEEIGRGDDVITIDVSIKPVTNEHDEVVFLVSEGRDITERAERERELEERATAMDASMDGMALLEANGEYTYVNEAHAKVYGYDDPSAFLGEHWRMCYDEAEILAFEEEVLPALERDGEWRGEATGKRRDGSQFPQELSLTALDKGGLVCVVRDVTDRKERERELERSEELLEKTQRMANVGGWELDLRADELRWTDEVRRIHDLPLDYEPALEEALDFYHPEDAPVMEAAVERAIEHGESYDIEVRLISADDELKWTHASGQARQENGETVVVRGAFQDITERKEHEQKLETYASMVNSVPDFVYRLDADGRYIAVNDTAEAVTGYSPAEMRGEHVSIIMDDDDIATGEGMIRDLLRDDDRGQATFEMDIVTAEGERVPFECHISVVRSEEGTFRGTVGIVRDITERKRNEERLRALHEGTREMIEATTREEVCAVVAETSKRVLGHSITVVRLLAEDGETLVPIAQTDETRERIGERPAYPVGDTPAGRAYREGRARIYDDLVALDTTALDERYDPGNSRAAMYTPVGTHGVISVADTTPERFDRSDLQLAKVLAANAQTALDRVEHERRLQSLHEGTRAMTNAETLEEVVELVVETARNALGYALTGCWLYDPDDGCLRPTAVTDEAHGLFDEFPTYTAGNSLSWEVFTTGDPAVYDDVGSQPGAYDPETPIESEIIVPLGEYGVLNCGSTEPGTFDAAALSATRILAANTEAALERAEREALLRDRETQLEYERDRLAALFENIPDPVFRHSRENGAIVPQAVNPAFERVFGYDEERVVGKPITETIVPSDRIEEHEALAAASGVGESLNAEVERLTATGRRTFLLRNAPIDTSTGDQSVEYAIYTDITDRHEAEEYRRRLYEIISDTGVTAEERVNRLLELGCERLDMATGFLTRIAEGTQRIVEAHGPYEQIQPGSECPLSRAYCRRTIEADSLLTLWHAAETGWEDDPAYEEFGLEAYVGSKLTIGGDLYGTVCFADRAPRETEFSAAELVFVDLVTRAVASELERRRYERKLEHQNNRLEEFASVVSHDLRNPLTVAMGYLEFVPEEGNEEFLRKIRNAHDRIERIIEDVLTLARQGQSIGKTSPVDLASVAEQAWNNVETGEAELSIGDDHDLGTIEADEGRLEQVFENLFRNAIEHGGENVTVRIGHSATGFYIEDDGPGIPEDQREQVFDHGHTTSESGTGFGLSIVEQIAEAHGWKIAVAEGTDGGARFEISM